MYLHVCVCIRAYIYSSNPAFLISCLRVCVWKCLRAHTFWLARARKKKRRCGGDRCLLQYNTHYETHTTTHTETQSDTLQQTAPNCNTLPHTATHCHTLQHTTTHCKKLRHTAKHATNWNKLHHTASHCNILQHAATKWHALQHTATYCKTLQHTTTWRTRRALKKSSRDGQMCCSAWQCVIVL